MCIRDSRDNNLYRVYFEASPIPEEQRKAGFGGVNRYDYLEGYESSELIVNTSERVDILTKELVIQSKSLDEIELLAKNKYRLYIYLLNLKFLNNNWKFINNHTIRKKKLVLPKHVPWQKCTYVHI